MGMLGDMPDHASILGSIKRFIRLMAGTIQSCRVLVRDQPDAADKPNAALRRMLARVPPTTRMERSAAKIR
jgi:hypothetical protein